jgi:thiol-disulfide isomerase/thioredoxin
MQEQKRVFLIMKFVAVGLTLFVLILLFYQYQLNNVRLNNGTRTGVPDLGPVAVRPAAVPFVFKESLQKSEMAARTTYADLENQIIELKKFKNKVIYINFWAHWCEPCIQELPLIEKLIKEFGDSLAVILINMDKGDVEIVKAREFQKRTAPSVTGIYEHPQALENMLNITALPGHILIDKQGRTAAAFVGSFEDEYKKFKNILKQLIAE